MNPESRTDRIGNSHRLRPHYRRAGVILIVAICVAGSAFAFSNLHTRMYRATVVLMYGPQTDPANVFAQSLIDAQTLQNQLASVSRLIKDPTVARDATTTILGQTQLRVPYSVSASVETTPLYAAAVIAGVSASPRMAQVAASAYADRFIAWRKAAEVAQWTIAVDSVRRRMGLLTSKSSPDYLALQQQLQTDLQAQAAAFGSFRVIQTATIPSRPFTPKPLRDAIVAFFVAVLVGGGVTLLLDETGARLRDARDARRVLRVPVLGELRGSRSAKGNGSTADVESLSPDEKVAVDALRANVDFLLTDLGARSVVFVSPDDGQGVGSVASDAAVSLALTGRRVTVVDGDVRNGYVTERFGLDGDSGVSSVVSGSVTLEDAVHLIDLGSSAKELQTVAQARIQVLCAGPAVADPALVSRSHGFAALVGRLAEDAEVVVVVAPAFEGVDDAAAVCSTADAAICVVDLATARRRSLEAAQDCLQGLPCEFLGAVILNKAKRSKALSSPVVSTPPESATAGVEVEVGVDDAEVDSCET